VRNLGESLTERILGNEQPNPPILTASTGAIFRDIYNNFFDILTVLIFNLKSSIQLFSAEVSKRTITCLLIFSRLRCISQPSGPCRRAGFLGGVRGHRRVAPHPTSGGEPRHPPTILLSSEIRTPTDSTKSSALKSSK
jgi:hypothetical protein